MVGQGTERWAVPAVSTHLLAPPHHSWPSGDQSEPACWGKEPRGGTSECASGHSGHCTGGGWLTYPEVAPDQGRGSLLGVGLAWVRGLSGLQASHVPDFVRKYA